MKTNDFLPTDYKPPQDSGNYMKLEDGDNRIRILSNPVLGYELWIQGKPKRIHMNQMWNKEDIENADINKFDGKKRKPTHFWALVVWNYKLERIQILQINKSKIQSAITALNTDIDWGSPLAYDIVINKTGEKLETKYNVIPKPAKPVSPEVEKAFHDAHVNLEALFSGLDPFSGEEESVTSDETD